MTKDLYKTIIDELRHDAKTEVEKEILDLIERNPLQAARKLRLETEKLLTKSSEAKK